MRAIWQQENELMLQLVPVLKNMRSEDPTDVFFFEIVPVPPPNLRPVKISHCLKLDENVIFP